TGHAMDNLADFIINIGTTPLAGRIELDDPDYECSGHCYNSFLVLIGPPPETASPSAPVASVIPNGVNSAPSILASNSSVGTPQQTAVADNSDAGQTDAASHAANSPPPERKLSFETVKGGPGTRTWQGRWKI